MLQKLLSKPVELKLDGKVITFNSLDDFEFALGARTTIPLEKINEAIKASPGDLDLESNAIYVAIEQLTELNDQSSEKGEITQSLKGINPIIFSNDNGWRDIFFALKKDHSTDSSKYKQIALTTYLKYLSNRQEMIQMIKAQLEKDNIQEDNAEAAQFRTGELDLDEKFDANKLAEESGMSIMPKAEPVIIEINPDEEITMLLAHYPCKLIVDDGIQFIDNDNVAYPMTIGMNKVGRGSECKVRFMDSMQRISRLHLMIINHDDKKLEITDLSTYGTHYLKKSV
jgi:FHA domain-containing protein